MLPRRFLWHSILALMDIEDRTGRHTAEGEVSSSLTLRDARGWPEVEHGAAVDFGGWDAPCPGDIIRHIAPPGLPTSDPGRARMAKGRNAAVMGVSVC